MSRRCVVTGKQVMSGNNVSHANNKTKRKFLPNIQETSVFSEVLQTSVRLKVSMAGLRTIEHNGGFDKWVLSIAPTKIDPSLKKIRAQVASAVEGKAA